MDQLKKRIITPCAISIIFVFLLSSTLVAADYYEEPTVSLAHASLAYIAKNNQVLVLAIDGKAVFGDSAPQRLMPLEGATLDKYLNVTPGTHQLHLRIFYQVNGGSPKMSDVSVINFQFHAGRTYYPLAKNTRSETGKIKADFSLIEINSKQ